MSLDYSKPTYNQFFTDVMKWLMIGLGLTALTSFLINITGIIYYFAEMHLPILIMFGLIEILLVIFLRRKVENMAYQTAKKYYWIYSVINGITMSFVLEVVGPYISILAFLLTTAYFGLLYTICKYSKSEFIGVGKVCIAALPILLIAWLLLLFINAPTLYYIVIFADLAIFTGLTLFDIKKIKRIYQSERVEKLEGMAVVCALELYLDFINIFLDIIHLLNNN